MSWQTYFEGHGDAEERRYQAYKQRLLQELREEREREEAEQRTREAFPDE